VAGASVAATPIGAADRGNTPACHGDQIPGVGGCRTSDPQKRSVNRIRLRDNAGNGRFAGRHIGRKPTSVKALMTQERMK
jgi:hypothetical protein